MKKLIAAALTAALMLPATAAVANPGERPMARKVNQSRVAHGLRPLNRSWALNQPARRHSKLMANQAQIFHSSSYGCSYWGENVGAVPRGPGAIKRLHRAFMESRSHRQNILNPYFTRMGVGIVARGDVLWATVVFARGSC